MWSGGGGQGGFERRMEDFVKILKIKFWGGGVGLVWGVMVNVNEELKFWGQWGVVGGRVDGGVGNGVGVRVDVNEESKFLGKFKKKIGGRVGGVGSRSGGGGVGLGGQG